jgi:uncharacterized membrane protein
VRELHALQEAEQRAMERVRQRARVARQVFAEHQAHMTLGERLADDLAHFVGSWTFIILFLAFCLVWMAINAVELLVKPWDPYPFILLNLFLSLVAGLQAPVIMMSQNRQEARDRLRSEADYEVNLKAELEITQLHDKIDELRDHRWRELLAIQQDQIEMLKEQIRLLRAMAPAVGDDAGQTP